MLCREWGVAYVGGGKRGMCAWWGENAEHVTLLGTEMWKIRPKNKTKKKNAPQSEVRRRRAARRRASRQGSHSTRAAGSGGPSLAAAVRCPRRRGRR